MARTYIHLCSLGHKRMHAHIHVYIHAYIHTYLHTKLSMRDASCMHKYTIHTYRRLEPVQQLIEKYLYRMLHTYIQSFVHTYIHTYVRTYIHTYIHTGVCKQCRNSSKTIYTGCYTHTYRHLCIHTYIHTCIQAFVSSAETRRKLSIQGDSRAKTKARNQDADLEMALAESKRLWEIHEVHITVCHTHSYAHLL
jgi:hypothetical protein